MTDATVNTVDVTSIELLSVKEQGAKIPTIHFIVKRGELPERIIQGLPDTYELANVEYRPATETVDFFIRRVAAKFETVEHDDHTFSYATHDSEEEYDGEEETASYFDVSLPENYEIDNISKSKADEIEASKLQYQFSVPLAYAQTALMLSSSSQSPLIVITDEETEPERLEDMGEGFATFDSVVLTPAADTPEHVRLFSVLTKASTGHAAISIKQEDFGRIRFDLLRMVNGISEGNLESLVELYSYINRLDAFIGQKEDETFIPSTEQQEVIVLKDTIFALLRYVHPTTLANTLSILPNGVDQHLTTLSEFEKIMLNAGFNENEEESMEATGSDLFVTVNSDSSNDEKLAYLSSDIKPETIPSTMLPLLDKLNIPSLYEVKWGQMTISDDKINTGEGMAAALIVIAIRLARAKQISDAKELTNSIPLTVAVALSGPQEQITWALLEMMRRLPIDTKGIFLDLLPASVRNPDEPRDVMRSPLAFILHQLGHAILNEKLSHDVLNQVFKDQPIIMSFADDVVEIASKQNEESEDNGCPAGQAIMSLVSLGFSISDITSETADALLALAEFSAWKGANASPGSNEWVIWKSAYLATMTTLDEQ